MCKIWKQKKTHTTECFWNMLGKYSITLSGSHGWLSISFCVCVCVCCLCSVPSGLHSSFCSLQLKHVFQVCPSFPVIKPVPYALIRSLGKPFHLLSDSWRVTLLPDKGSSKTHFLQEYISVRKFRTRFLFLMKIILGLRKLCVPKHWCQRFPSFFMLRFWGNHRMNES